MKGLTKLLGIGALTLGMTGLVGKSDAGVITVKNDTSDLSVGISTLTMKNIPGATEGYDGYPTDSLFASSPYTNALETYTMVEGHKLSTDARPVNTSGWDINLGVKGSVSHIDNYLRYKVTDPNDLSDKGLVLYDTANTSTMYTLLQDNAYHNIVLSNDFSHGAGQYATWRLDVAMEGDANLDGTVNFSDLVKVIANYNQSGQTWATGDFNADGTVNFTDLLKLIANYNQSYPGEVYDDMASLGFSIPEPGALELLVGAGIAGAGYAALKSRRRGKKEE